MKLSIVSILIRDTPYIFLDEPTNHLDDQSTNKLICLLRKLKDRKTIIIVSHDKRLENAFGCNVCIKDNNVEQKNVGIGRPINEGNPGTVSLNMNYWRRKLLCSLNLLAVWLILIVASVFLISYNEIMFSDGYSFDECSYSDDMIHTYKAECEYTDTNKRYVDKNHIKIQGDNDKMISSEEDVKLISESQYVKEIVLFDEEAFYDTINADTKTKTVAIPDFFIRDYLNQTYDGGELIGKIVEGRYPEDYKKEIALSKNSSVIDDYEVQIGQSIDYLGEEYVIVGILDDGYDMISYDGKDRNGFFTDDDMKNHDIGSCGLFIMTEEGREKEVLDSLISQYPAENYTSKVFTMEWKESYNTEFVITEVLPLNIIVSFLFAIVSMISRWFQMKNDMELYRDWMNSSLNPRRVRYNVLVVNLLCIFAEMMIIIVVNALASVVPLATSMILLLDLLIMSIPGMVMLEIKGRLR